MAGAELDEGDDSDGEGEDVFDGDDGNRMRRLSATVMKNGQRLIKITFPGVAGGWHTCIAVSEGDKVFQLLEKVRGQSGFLSFGKNTAFTSLRKIEQGWDC